MNKYIVTAMALLAAGTVTARHLSPDEALGRLTGSEARRLPASLSKAPQLLYSAKADGLERVYLFGHAAKDGFMIVSGDDAVPALLGYSDSETIAPDNLPDNLRYWLDEYARQIAYAAQNTDGEPATPAIKQRATVEPKLTTIWDQLQPFNKFTPMHSAMPTPTGCVATAVAQIMNWHKWPEQPTGKKSFNSYYIGTLSIDFDRIKFDWDKMLDRYYLSSPEENIDAVATLMMAVGYASEMVYNQNSSGATGYNAANGMLTYFGYNKAMTLENREWYDIEEWDDLVYAELTENGPVYYEGTGDGGGHAFVCDGYDGETGLFHFNWGWSGKGNGYYRLSALDPDYQGTGGNSLGYNYTQDIIRGLKKSTGTDDEKPVYMFAPRKGVVSAWEEAELGKPVTIKGYETLDGFNNYSVVTVPGVEFGVRLHNLATGEDIDVLSQNGKYDFAPYNKTNIIRYALPTDLAEGSYNLTPVWRTNEGPWQTMRTSPQTRNYVPVTVAAGKATFGFGEAEARLEAKITDAPEYFTTAGEFTIKGTMSSVGTHDFTGLLCAVFVKKDAAGNLQIIDQGESQRVDLEPGKTIDFEYTSYPQTKKELVDGDDYGLVIGNANTGELISPVYAVKVGNRYGALEMTTYNYKITSSSFLDPENVNVQASIKVVAGEYEGPLAVGFSTKKDPFEPTRFTVSADDKHLIAGDDKPVTFSGVLDGVEEGEIYYAHLMYKGTGGEWTQLSNYPITVVVAKTYSGVENVATGEDEAEYYDTFGRKVANPSPGSIYIRVTPQGSKKVIF